MRDTVERDPSCDLDECRFYDTEAGGGYRIVCFNPEHTDRSCPGEGVMFLMCDTARGKNTAYLRGAS